MTNDKISAKAIEAFINAYAKTHGSPEQSVGAGLDAAAPYMSKNMDYWREKWHEVDSRRRIVEDELEVIQAELKSHQKFAYDGYNTGYVEGFKQGEIYANEAAAQWCEYWEFNPELAAVIRKLLKTTPIHNNNNKEKDMTRENEAVELAIANRNYNDGLEAAAQEVEKQHSAPWYVLTAAIRGLKTGDSLVDQIVQAKAEMAKKPVYASDVDPTAGLNPDFKWDGNG